jgi:class 3 adenylate cyclase
MKPSNTILQNKVSSPALNDTIRFIDDLNNKSFQQRHLNQRDSGEDARQALQLSTEAAYHKGRGNALLNLGFQELNYGQYDKAFNSFNQSLQIFKNIDDLCCIAHAYYNLGLVYLRLGDYDNSMEVFQESHRIRKELNDEDGVAACKSHIAYINLQFGLDDMALSEYNQCIAIYRMNENKAALAAALMGLGTLKMKLKKLDEAKHHLTESMNIRKNLNEINGWLGSINYLSDVYLEEGNFQEALKLLEDALHTALNQPQPFAAGICRLHTNMAKTYVQVKDYPNAIIHLENALHLAIKTKQQYQLHEIYFQLAALYKSLQVFDKALDYFEKFHTSKQEVISLNASAKLRNLEMINKVEVREKEIEIHRLKNIELKERNRIIKEERKKSDSLLLNILPRQTARELKKNGTAKARRYDLVTVLFCDFVNFTKTAEKLSPEELVSCIDKYFRAFDEIINRYNVEKIKTIGDAYMAAGGVPIANTTNPVEVVNAALEMITYVNAQNDPLFKLRLGINTGAVVAGIVGIKKFAYDIWGDTVNIASRMESSGEANKVNISGNTYQFVKEHFNCLYRGKIEAKNKGMIDMYFVEAPLVY